jgi:hypothetical protein
MRLPLDWIYAEEKEREGGEGGVPPGPVMAHAVYIRNNAER